MGNGLARVDQKGNACQALFGKPTGNGRRRVDVRQG